MDRCDNCGCDHAFRLTEYWDWPGKVRFLFCTPSCRMEAEQVLGIKMIDAFTRDQRRRIGK